MDLFDKKSNRTGSATIDQRTGRIDTYDVNSRRTGYGTVDPRTGRFESFDLRGNRQGHGYIHPAPGPRATPDDVGGAYDRDGRRIERKGGKWSIGRTNAVPSAPRSPTAEASAMTDLLGPPWAYPRCP